MGSLGSTKTGNISETVQYRTKVTMTDYWTNRKSHTRFRLVPKSVTLDDLERHIQGLSKVFKYPLLSQAWVKLRTSNLASTFAGSKFCTHFNSIDGDKSPLTISGKVVVGVARDSRKFSGHPYIGRIARSSLR